MTKEKLVSLLAAAALIATVLFAPGCSPSQLQGDVEVAKAVAQKAQADAAKLAVQAKETKRKALKTAKDTLALLESGYVMAVAAGVLSPDVAKKTGDALLAARTLLARVEAGEKVGRSELAKAITDVEQVVRDLRAAGRELAPLVDSSIDLVRVAVEGAS